MVLEKLKLAKIKKEVDDSESDVIDKELWEDYRKQLIQEQTESADHVMERVMHKTGSGPARDSENQVHDDEGRQSGVGNGMYKAGPDPARDSENQVSVSLSFFTFTPL